jgi:hypothetical protein
MRLWLPLALALWWSVALAQAPDFYAQDHPGQGLMTAPITPVNGVPLAKGPTRAIFLNNASACTLVMQLALDTAPSTWFFAIGQLYLPLAVWIVNATGSTCTGMMGVW